MDANWMDLLDEKNKEIEQLREDCEQMRDALRWALPYVKNDERVGAIVSAALKEGE